MHTITMVPNVASPSVNQLEPIACCTMVYKIISKILICRFQKVITKDVDLPQL